MILKFLFASGVTTVTLIAGLGLLFLDPEPLVERAPTPTPQDVAEVRKLVREIRDTAGLDAKDDNPRLEVSVEQLNTVVRLGARFIPGFRGRMWVAADKVEGEASLPVPWVNGRKWLNIQGTIPPFHDTFRLERIIVGGRNVSPAPALFTMRTGANLIAGNRFGNKVLQSASAMEIHGNTLQFDISLDAVGRNGVMRGTFGMLRGAQMPSAEEVEVFHKRIREAMARGDLPLTGSFLPYIQFTLSEVLARSTPQTLPNIYTAAIFGLAKACGARDFSMIVGRLAFGNADTEESWPTSCDEIVLNGRIDSRRHFITSAAIQAASNSRFAVSVGEFKELYDTISGAGGFDFTDMAANLSGIRMSNVLMSLPRSDWPYRLALIETENDVIVSFESIPTLMPEEAFKSRFRDVDSTAYRAMLAQIEASINGLELYRGL